MIPSQKLRLYAEPPDLRSVATALSLLFGDKQPRDPLLMENKSVSERPQMALSNVSPVICAQYGQAILLPWWKHHALHDSPNKFEKTREISRHIEEAQR